MRMILLGVTLAIFTLSCGRPSDSHLASSPQELQYVRVPTAMLTRDWVARNEFNRDHGKDTLFAVGWISSKSLQSLPKEDKASITVLDSYKVSQGLLDPFTLVETPRQFADLSDAEDYHNFEALTAELKLLADTYSSIAQLESAGKSVKGRDLWYMRLSSSINDSGKKPKLLYIANMHGDEVVGRELNLYLIRKLLQDYGKDARITSLLQHSEIFIMPSMNPDGFELRQRFNARGVDLNRNFPDFTSDNRDSTAGRAIETAAIMELHSKHHFVSALNFHGGDVCFNLPWDTQANEGLDKFGDDAVLNPMGRQYADANATMRANNSFDQGLTYGFEWYEVDGGMQDWSIYYRNSMHATVELSYTKWPAAGQLTKAWNENKDAMISYLERSIKGIHLDVVDPNGNPVTGIKVRVSSSKRSVQFSQNFGTRTTTDGLQTVTVEASGFQPATFQLMARTFDGRYDQVILNR